MNKARIETLADGVFAIAMTLLVLDVKVPEVEHLSSNTELIQLLAMQWPIVVSYLFSFLILAVAWINHHFLFHAFAKEVNRQMNLLNMLYLMMIAFLPFSAHLLGEYHEYQAAVVIYGLNISAVVLVAYLMLGYMTRNRRLMNEHVSERLIRQAKIRSELSLVSYGLGIGVSFVFPVFSMIFFIFPLLFNIIPGTLDFSEWLFGIKI